MRILLLDRDRTHIRICRFLLHANSHTCRVVSTADAAALKLQQAAFDLLLADAALFQQLQQDYPALIRRIFPAIVLFTDLRAMPRAFGSLKDSFDIFPKPLNLTKMLYIQSTLSDVPATGGPRTRFDDGASCAGFFNKDKN